jgi:hypothetical protein
MLIAKQKAIAHYTRPAPIIKPKQFKKLAVMIAKEDKKGWHRFINKVLVRG